MNLNALTAKLARRAVGFALVEDYAPQKLPVKHARDERLAFRPALAFAKPLQRIQTAFQRIGAQTYAIPVYARCKRSQAPSWA